MEKIELMISDFISRKVKSVKEEIQVFLNEEKERNDLHRKAYKDLLAFEEKHRKELESIYIITSCPWMYGRETSTYFGSVYNEIAQYFNCSKQDVERIKSEKGLLSDDHVLITYSDFEKETGLSSTTIKKYLEIMSIKGTVRRRRAIFGYVYAIPEEKSNN